MNHIDKILIRHGVYPEVITPTEKKGLAEWLAALEQGDALSFHTFANNAETKAASDLSLLLEQADHLLELVTEITRSIEPLLADYPTKAVTLRYEVEPSVLTRKHTVMLTALEPVQNKTERLAAELAPEDPNGATHLLAELSLRRIALSESEKHKPLFDRYNSLLEKLNAPTECAKKMRDSLTDNGIALHEALSELVQNSSQLLTASNRKKVPQSDYFKCLQQAIIRFHAIARSVDQIKTTSHPSQRN